MNIQKKPNALTGFKIVVTNVGYAYSCLHCGETYLPSDPKLKTHLQVHLDESLAWLPKAGVVFLNTPTAEPILVLEAKTSTRGLVELRVAKFKNSSWSKENPAALPHWEGADILETKVSESWKKIGNVEMTNGLPKAEFHLGYRLKDAVVLRLTTTGKGFTFKGATYIEATHGSQSMWFAASIVVAATTSIVHCFTAEYLENVRKNYFQHLTKLSPEAMIGLSGEPLYRMEYSLTQQRRGSYKSLITESDLTEMIDRVRE